MSEKKGEFALKDLLSSPSMIFIIVGVVLLILSLIQIEITNINISVNVPRPLIAGIGAALTILGIILQNEFRKDHWWVWLLSPLTGVLIFLLFNYILTPDSQQIPTATPTATPDTSTSTIAPSNTVTSTPSPTPTSTEIFIESPQETFTPFTYAISNPNTNPNFLFRGKQLYFRYQLESVPGRY